MIKGKLYVPQYTEILYNFFPNVWSHRQGTDEADGADIKDEKGEGLPRCKVCSGTKNRNKGGKPEPLIICGSCRSASK